MPSDPPDPTWTPDAIEALRAELRRIGAERGMSATTIAREAGVAPGTWSMFMSNSYNGRNDSIAEKAKRWIASLADRDAAKAIAPDAPSFQMTPTAKTMFELLGHAQHMPDLVVVAAGAGCGKTTAACAYTRRHPNVFKVVAEPCANGPRAMLEDFLRAAGVGTKIGNSLHLASRTLAERLRGTQALLIVDEAQHLTTVAIDQLRTLHDKAEIGVALVGNETVLSRIEGAGRTAEFAQLFSRVGMRLKRARPMKGDIDALVDAWNIEDPTQRNLLHAIARKPGALRGMTKTLRVAHMLATSERRAITAEDIRLAWERLSSDTTLTVGEAA
jgi:DNA transposition AAA+ family ATPase